MSQRIFDMKMDGARTQATINSIRQQFEAATHRAARKFDAIRRLQDEANRFREIARKRRARGK